MEKNKIAFNIEIVKEKLSKYSLNRLSNQIYHILQR